MNLSDVLDKIEPYLTQEELAVVGQMEVDLKQMEVDLKELRQEIFVLEESNDDLEKQITDLENDVNKLNDDVTELQDDVESLKLFRDPSNWDGNKFIPVLHYQRVSDPWNL